MSSSKKGEERKALGAAARRALLPLLAGIYRENSQTWLSKCLPDHEGVLGLHLGCGSGEDTFLLGSLINENDTLHGIEADIALIEAARHGKVAGKWKQVQFFCAYPLSWKNDRKYDFIYSRIWASDLLEQARFLSGIRQHLKKVGRLIVEAMPFSGYSAFPYNHAFARSAALIAQVERGKASKKDLPEAFYSFFEREEFQVLEVTHSSPLFLPQKYNGVISLLLEVFKEKILQLRLSTNEELNALHQELKLYETQKDILISRPGIHQILATQEGAADISNMIF